MTEPLAALLTLAAFWLAVRDARPARGSCVGALVLGVAALVRPQALLCAPFLAGVVAERAGASGALARRRRRRVALASRSCPCCRGPRATAA